MVREDQYLAWSQRLVAGVMLVASMFFTLNVFYDFYGIFNLGWSDKSGINLDQRYAKIEYLEQHKGQFDTFLLGSSRMGHIPDEQLRANGLRPYNLGVFSGTPRDYLLFIRYLEREGHPIKRLYIGLDYYSFFDPPDLSKPEFQHHPKVSGESLFSFYRRYFFRSSFVYLATELNYYFGQQPPPYEHDMSSGRFVPARAIQELNADEDAYWTKATEKTLKSLEARKNASRRISPMARSDLLELVRHVQNKSYDTVFFVHPEHHVAIRFYNDSARNDFDQLLSEAQLSDTTRFDLISCLGENNGDYYDVMHYRPFVGAVMLEALLKDGPIKEVLLCKKLKE